MDIFFQCVQDAFQRTKDLIWPHQWRRWWRLFFIYFFLGAIITNPFIGFPTGQRDDKTAKELSTAISTTTLQIFTQTNQPDQLNELTEKFQGFFKKLKWGFGIFLGVMFLGFAVLVFILMWVSSHISFVLVDTLKKNAVHIRQSWRETYSMGQSFFWMNVIISLLFLSGLGLAIGGSVWNIIQNGFDGWSDIIKGVGLFFSFVTASIIIGIITNIIYRFLPFIMDKTKKGSRAALLVGWNWVRRNILTFLAQVFFYFVLVMGISIVMWIFILVVMLILAIPLVLGGVAFAAVIKEVPGIIQALMGIGMVVGGFAVLLVFLIWVTVPIQTFFAYLRMLLVERQITE